MKPQRKGILTGRAASCLVIIERASWSWLKRRLMEFWREASKEDGRNRGDKWGSTDLRYLRA